MGMKRLIKFESLATNSWHAKSFAKLKPEEVAYCVEFIKKNDHLEPLPFSALCNRLFLDEPVKPKNWVRMSELLSCANT